jgi:hypothetical protein
LILLMLAIATPFRHDAAWLRCLPPFSPLLFANSYFIFDISFIDFIIADIFIISFRHITLTLLPLAFID